MQLQSEIIPIMCHILVKLLKMFTLTFVYMYVCILCICLHRCLPCSCGGQRIAFGSPSMISIQKLNLGCQAQQQVLLPALP